MKIWTEPEIEALKARYPYESATALADVFGVDSRQITQKAYGYGLEKKGMSGTKIRGRNHQAKIWTEAEDAEIRKQWREIYARIPGKTTVRLAQQLGVSACQLRHRAAMLGLRKQRQKELPWADYELDLLSQYQHLAVSTVRAKLKKHGYIRSDSAIIMQRYRRLGGLLMADGGYSASQVASYMGTTGATVLRWIHKGLLKATPRGDSKNQFDGPGDRWNITPKQIKAFVTDNVVLINPRGINFVWLIDILTNRL